MDIKGLLQKELSKIKYAQGLTSKDVKIDCDLGVAIITNIVKELNLLDVIKWVSVEEKLPDEDKFVLCARLETSMGGTKRIPCAIGTANKNGRFSCAFDWIDVDYWAEIPTAPFL